MANKKKYTFTVCCTFNVQFTFDESEVEPDPGGDETDVEPKDEALETLEREIESYLSEQYGVFDFDASTDSGLLLGVAEEPE